MWMLVWDRMYDFNIAVPCECYKEMKNEISHKEIQYNQNTICKLSLWTSTRRQQTISLKKRTHFPDYLQVSIHYHLLTS